MRKIITHLIVLLFVSASASGSTINTEDCTTRVMLPSNSGLLLHEDASQPGYFSFEGQSTATGLIVAYWEVYYPEVESTSLEGAQPVREMYLRFYPDPTSQSGLPSFLLPSGTTVAPQRIFLYRDHDAGTRKNNLISAYTEHDMGYISRLVETFSEVPDNFITHREGMILQPAEVILEDMLSFVEADHRFLYGRMVALKPLSVTEYFSSQLPDTAGFLGAPWIEMLHSPGPLLIRETPDPDGKVLLELPMGAPSLKKIRTIDEGWILVELPGATKNNIIGYARKSDLYPVN